MHAVKLISCDHGPEMETSFPRACGRPHLLWKKSVCQTHESHWYSVILQIEANIFVLFPISRGLELNDLLIELKI